MEVLGLYLLPPYCPCTQLLKSENLYKPIYFETADYGLELLKVADRASTLIKRETGLTPVVLQVLE